MRLFYICAILSLISVVLSDKPEVVIHTQGIHDYVLDYLDSDLSQLFNDPLIKAIDIKMIPFGNTEYYKRINSYKCLNGNQECKAQLYQWCAINKYGVITSFPYYKCIQAHSKELPEWGWKCAYNNKFDKALLKECIKNDVNLMQQLFMEKDTLHHKPFPYLPFITINGKECTDGCKNIKSQICSVFKSGEEPSTCLSASSHVPVFTSKTPESSSTESMPVAQKSTIAVPEEFKTSVDIVLSPINEDCLPVLKVLQNNYMNNPDLSPYIKVTFNPIGSCSVTDAPFSIKCPNNEKEIYAIKIYSCLVHSDLLQDDIIPIFACFQSKGKTLAQNILKCLANRIEAMTIIKCTTDASQIGKYLSDFKQDIDTRFAEGITDIPTVTIDNSVCPGMCSDFSTRLEQAVTIKRNKFLGIADSAQSATSETVTETVTETETTVKIDNTKNDNKDTNENKNVNESDTEINEKKDEKLKDVKADEHSNKDNNNNDNNNKDNNNNNEDVPIQKSTENTNDKDTTNTNVKESLNTNKQEESTEQSNDSQGHKENKQNNQNNNKKEEEEDDDDDEDLIDVNQLNSNSISKEKEKTPTIEISKKIHGSKRIHADKEENDDDDDNDNSDDDDNSDIDVRSKSHSKVMTVEDIKEEQTTQKEDKNKDNVKEEKSDDVEKPKKLIPSDEAPIKRLHNKGTYDDDDDDDDDDTTSHGTIDMKKTTTKTTKEEETKEEKENNKESDSESSKMNIDIGTVKIGSKRVNIDKIKPSFYIPDNKEVQDKTIRYSKDRTPTRYRINGKEILMNDNKIVTESNSIADVYMYETKRVIHRTNIQTDFDVLTPMNHIRRPLHVYSLFDLHSYDSYMFLQNFIPFIKRSLLDDFYMELIPAQTVYLNTMNRIRCRNSEDRQCNTLYLWLCATQLIKKETQKWKFTLCIMKNKNNIYDSIQSCLDLIHITGDMETIKKCSVSDEMNAEILYYLKIRDRFFYDRQLENPLYSVNGIVYTNKKKYIVERVCKHYSGVLPTVCEGPERIDYEKDYYKNTVDTIMKMNTQEIKDIVRVDIYIDNGCPSCNMFINNEMTWLMKHQEGYKYINMYIHPHGSLQLNSTQQLNCLNNDINICYINMVIQCVNMQYLNSYVQFTFNRCLLGHGNNALDYIEDCADAALINPDSIYSCMNKGYARDLLTAEIQSMEPKINTILSYPHILINNQLIEHYTDIYRHICKLAWKTPSWCSKPPAIEDNSKNCPSILYKTFRFSNTRKTALRGTDNRY